MAWLGGMGRGNIGTLIVALSLSVGFFAERPAMADERKILVASFENIQVIGDIKVQVQTGKAPSATAKGDKRVLDALKLERVGMTLRVRLQGALNNEKGVPMTQPLEVMLSTQAIKDVTVSGNGETRVHVDEAANIFNRGTGTINVGGNGSCFVKQAGSAFINCARIEKGSPK